MIKRDCCEHRHFHLFFCFQSFEGHGHQSSSPKLLFQCYLLAQQLPEEVNWGRRQSSENKFVCHWLNFEASWLWSFLWGRYLCIGPQFWGSAGPVQDAVGIWNWNHQAEFQEMKLRCHPQALFRECFWAGSQCHTKQVKHCPWTPGSCCKTRPDAERLWEYDHR